jgi:hypothetical protein
MSHDLPTTSVFYRNIFSDVKERTKEKQSSGKKKTSINKEFNAS